MITEPATDDPLIGTVINGYRVMQTIGRGGMGAVYRAVQPTIDAEVAIKVLGDELAREPEAVERFIAEAKTANLVRHEGLVKVIGLGVLPDGRPYQIMEHLTGLPLSAVIHPGIPLGTLCMRLAEALRAIGAMHARGIIHRDLKPANLFVTTAGYIKVLDFGIAKLAHTTGLTRTGHTIGTPEYMSPEQAEAAALDHRSDLYSMGIVVYECITGVRPFEGRVVEAMVLRERPPHVEPAALDAIVQTAMAAEPRAWDAIVAAMALALERAADGLPEGSLLDALVTAPPPAATTLAAPTVVGSPARLGRYVIEGVVGRGGQGQVLVAHDPRVDRKVALKLVSARGSERERVLAEARAMAKVNHPNVVTLFELGEDGDHVFLAMEYLDAIDLDGWLAAEPRAWDAIVARFVEAGRGLAAAHAAGVVHRDFKPANVLVAGDGRAKVGDFGIARADGATDVAQGTVGYMAPEQLEGGTVDPRADQFAFAAALWHALHRELPYGDGDKSAVAYALAVHRGELRAPANREIPSAINAVLRRALAAQPDARFPSMTALLAELAPRKRRRWPVIAVVALVVVVAGFAMLHRHTKGISLAEIAALPTSSDQLRALAALPEAERHTEAARVLAGRAALDGYVRTLTLPESAVGPIAISATGAVVAVLLEHGVWTYDVATKTAHQLALPSSKITALYLDENQHVVRAAVADGIVQAPVGGGPWATILQCETSAELAYDRALRVIAYDQHDRVFVHAIDSAPFSVDLSGNKLKLSDDGTRLYGISLDQTVITSVSLAGSHVVAKHTVPEGAQLLFGNQVLAVITAHAATVWDPETDDVAAWEDPSSEAIAQSSLIQGAQPRLALVTGTRSSYLVAITRAPLGLALTSMVKDPPQRLFGAGARLVELFATYVTVDSPEQLASWTLPGAPGLVTSDDAGDRIALLDDRTLRLWDVSLREPITITAQQLTRTSRNERWFAVRADDHLRWYTIDPLPALVAETPVPQPTKFVSSAVAQTAFFEDQTGTWLWRPPAAPRRITTRTRFSRIFDIGGVLVGLDHDHLVDVVDNKPRCNDLQPAAVASQGLAVVYGTPPQLCIVATNTFFALKDLPRGIAVLWAFTADGALAVAHSQTHAAIFDTRTGAAIPEPALDAIASPTYVEGTRDQMVVSAQDGVFALSPTGTRRLAGPSPLRSLEYVGGPEAFLIQDNQINAIELATGAHRLVGRTSVANSMMPLIYPYDHALGIHEIGRDVFTVWSIDPPTIAETERLLSRAN